MNEHAEFYQRHKDDEDEWGDAVAPHGSEKRLETIVSVRLSPDQEALLREQAEAHGVALSRYIREAALRDCPPVYRGSFVPTSETRASGVDHLQGLIASAGQTYAEPLIPNPSIATHSP